MLYSLQDFDCGQKSGENNAANDSSQKQYQQRI
jgi:hypothetical protein